MSDVVGEFSLAIEQVEGYQFQVNFEKAEAPWLVVDEPPPLGKDTGPNPSRVLAASIGSCLAMSLLFCLGKNKVQAAGLRAEVRAETIRNEKRRLRVGKIYVTIHADLAAGDKERARKCLGVFEEFCTVTASIRDGIEVDVKVDGIDA